ncbi:Uncharacterized protein Rs2_29117 [Raphanus sativus]|nr:Uncharacterized protein Rs2_29117 [Raphanus sativus]
MKRIHDPVKIVVPCTVVEAESPIPPDKGIHLDSYNGVFNDHQHVVASQREMRCRTKVNKGIREAASIDVEHTPSIDIEHVSEHKEFDMCGYIFDGDTTTRSDKSGKEEEKLEEEETNKERFSVTIDSSLPIWC